MSLWQISVDFFNASPFKIPFPFISLLQDLRCRDLSRTSMVSVSLVSEELWKPWALLLPPDLGSKTKTRRKKKKEWIHICVLNGQTMTQLAITLRLRLNHYFYSLPLASNNRALTKVKTRKNKAKKKVKTSIEHFPFLVDKSNSLITRVKGRWRIKHQQQPCYHSHLIGGWNKQNQYVACC